MDEKTLITLEFPKILEKLAAYADFSLSAELARALRPVHDVAEARRRLALTSEARYLLSVKDDFSIGGARDIRPLVDLASRAGVLQASELLDVKNTLVAARGVVRAFDRSSAESPNLRGIIERLPAPAGLIDAISRSISERGEVLDSASPKLESIRSESKVAHERLMSRLQRMVTDSKNAPILQEAIITQRNGRYVIPLRAEFKGRIRSIVHDQSSSGATLFVEPLAVVELNNRWQELQLAERDEVRRILAELSMEVGRRAPELSGMLDALGELDLALMCAKYADDLRASEPELVEPDLKRENHPGSVINLRHARHPLLEQAQVVPIDVILDPQTFALVITGPNTGGKTVTLKTVGLMVVMAQSGLHIPAQSGSSLSIFQDIYADIGDEQSIEQSLSTFSAHITNIVRVLGNANRETLVLFDELGAGTDPQEGAALARALLSYLVENLIPCLVATHYPELKTFAHATPGVVNASMEFDLRTLRPTYHLTVGLPGRSNALLIAERLGLPASVLEAARGEINPQDLRAEDLLDEIHRQRDLARNERAREERARQQAENLRRELAVRLDRIEDERMAILERARTEAEVDVRELRRELDELRREMLRARQPLDAVRSLQQQAESLEEAATRQPERQESDLPMRQPLKVGEKVRVRSLNMEGVVTALGEEEIEVQLGALRVRSRLGDIQRRGDEPPAATPATKKRSAPQTAGGVGSAPAKPVGGLHPSPGLELDLRGQRADEALEMLEAFIENAYLAGMPYVRIIHGKGTGRLRQAVRDALKQSRHVVRFEVGLDSEGGEGVTVAHVRQE